MITIIWPLAINVFLSCLGFVVTLQAIPKLASMFLKANLFGMDMNKKVKLKVPETAGTIQGCIFLVVLFLFIPVPFGRYLVEDSSSTFPHNKFVEMLAAMLSICCMLLLGFADDVLDLKWRHKLLLPTIASLPLLMVYYVNFNSTTIIVPQPFRSLFGFSVDLGVLYYCYMGMLAVFCTNAINILAGINGLEVGQAVVIAGSILAFDLVELHGEQAEAHLLSLYFIVPFFFTSLALMYHNWYPSAVFVGDSFCYTAGMTFAVVGILCHFSKTMLLFFIPQILNFLYSAPQLFRLIPCPRHRLPNYNRDLNRLEMSLTTFKWEEINFLARFCVKFGVAFSVIHLKEDERGFVRCNNLTLINFVLKVLGPIHEQTLTIILLVIQVMCSVFAFTIRYPLARLLYDA